MSAQYIVAGQYGQWDYHYVYPAWQSDQFVTGWSGSDSIAIDMNGDGTFDVRMVLWYSGQSMWTHERTVFIRPLANCEVAYLRTDSCYTQDSIPVFISADKYVEPLTFGTNIDNNETWVSDMQYLQRDSKNVWFPGGGNGTRCEDLTVDTTPVYIGVRILGTTTLYGWIKVSVWRTGQPYYTLRIHEIACQTGPVGITENLSSEVDLFPNPSQGVFTLQTGNNQGTVTITDVTGRVIHSQNVVVANTAIDLSAQAEGVYYVTFTCETEEFHQPLIISR